MIYFHIILHPTVRVYDFHIFITSVFPLVNSLRPTIATKNTVSENLGSTIFFTDWKDNEIKTVPQESNSQKHSLEYVPINGFDLISEFQLISLTDSRVRTILHSTIERFHSRGQKLCEFIRTKARFNMRKRLNSQHSHRFFVLEQQYGGRDVM